METTKTFERELNNHRTITNIRYYLIDGDLYPFLGSQTFDIYSWTRFNVVVSNKYTLLKQY